MSSSLYIFILGMVFLLKVKLLPPYAFIIAIVAKTMAVKAIIVLNIDTIVSLSLDSSISIFAILIRQAIKKEITLIANCIKI